MAKFKGRDLRIKVRTSTSPETFTVIGGARSDGITINNETVDVTDKDGAGWRELLQGAGITSMSLKFRVLLVITLFSPITLWLLL